MATSRSHRRMPRTKLVSAGRRVSPRVREPGDAIQERLLALVVVHHPKQFPRHGGVFVASGTALSVGDDLYWITASHVILGHGSKLGLRHIIESEAAGHTTIESVMLFDASAGTTGNPSAIRTALDRLRHVSFDPDLHDLAIVQLPKFESQGLLAGGRLRPFKMRDMKHVTLGTSVDVVLAGYPEEWKSDELTIENGAPVQFLQRSPAFLRVYEIAPSVDSARPLTQRARIGTSRRLDERQLQSIAGMSGGPLLAVDKRNPEQAKLLGIQSSWDGTKWITFERTDALQLVIRDFSSKARPRKRRARKVPS